jgi:hypothetical protein
MDRLADNSIVATGKVREIPGAHRVHLAIVRVRHHEVRSVFDPV